MKIILKAFLREKLISEYETDLRPDCILMTRPIMQGKIHHSIWAILKDLEFRVEIKGDP